MVLSVCTISHHHATQCATLASHPLPVPVQVLQDGQRGSGPLTRLDTVHSLVSTPSMHTGDHTESVAYMMYIPTIGDFQQQCGSNEFTDTFVVTAFDGELASHEATVAIAQLLCSSCGGSQLELRNGQCHPCPPGTVNIEHKFPFLHYPTGLNHTYTLFSQIVASFFKTNSRWGGIAFHIKTHFWGGKSTACFINGTPS